MFRPSHLVTGAVLLAVAACNDTTDQNFVHVVPVATVRFVNATDTPITIANGGVIDSVNINVRFGQQSGCMLVDLSTTVPTLTFTNAATGVVLTGFDVPLVIGANVTIVAFADTTGIVQFAGLANRFTPLAGSAALRFFNAAQPAGSLIMLGNGAPLTPLIAFGLSSNFANVAAGSTAVTFSNGNTVVLDAGLQTLSAGQTSTIVVGPAESGTTPLRFFTVRAC
jgi:hypothetical protein